MIINLLAQSNSNTVITVIAAVATLVFGGGGIYALLKVRPEAGQISVTAAQGAVIVQTGVIDSLKEENERLVLRIEVLERQMAAMEEYRSKVKELESLLEFASIREEGLKRENASLKKRVKALEGDVDDIKNGNGH